MAVLAAVSRLVGTGEENVAGDDIYGGSDRLLSQVIPKTGVVVKRVNTTDLDEVASAIGPWMKLVWVESPTNPRQQISDIRKIAEMAHAHGALALVDNSIMSPVLSQPLELGACITDIVMHSATKFIAGHSDVMAGVLAVNGERCDFLNFAKNTVCLQCDAKRPKRQLLPGEWECPQCNFLNYRRNMACFHCECKRPPDEFTEMQMEERQRGGPRMRSQKVPSRTDVSNAWNLDFDDNESDRADVATFEYADSRRLDEDFPHGRQGDEETTRGAEAGIYKNSRPPRDSGKGWTSSLRK